MAYKYQELLFLNKGEFEGSVKLIGAEIGKDLSFTNSNFTCGGNINGKKSIVADGAKVGGSVFLRNGFKAEDQVKLSGMNVGGVLDCGAGSFNSTSGEALLAEAIKVKGYVSLNKPNNPPEDVKGFFTAKGEVNLRNAEIGENLECDGGHFINPGGNALLAEGIKVSGDLFLRKDFKAEGIVNLRNAKIGLTLELIDIKEPSKMKLDLQYAQVGTLQDEEESWPEFECLSLDGLVYQSISQESSQDSKTRLRWLRRQTFSLQPYEQLAKLLTAKGDEKEAREILIAKHKDLHKHQRESKNQYQLIENFVYYRVVAYGYKPHQALLYIAGLVIIGAFVFHFASNHELFWQTRGLTEIKLCIEPAFSPIAYSLDASIPVINFHQLDYCLPDVRKGLNCGWILQIYFVIHITLGWLFTSLWVTSITGLIRKPTK